MHPCQTVALVFLLSLPLFVIYLLVSFYLLLLQLINFYRRHLSSEDNRVTYWMS